jgi:hypothetical protein
MLTGNSIESWPIADLVIAISDRVGRADQERFEPRLAIHQRQAGKVFAIQEQQVEDETDQRGVAAFEGILDQVESSSPIRQDAAKLAVQIGTLCW